MLSHVPLFATLWAVAHQAPLSTGFPRPEYWSGFPFPSPGDLPDPGIKPVSLKSPALAGGFFITEPPEKPFSFTKCQFFTLAIGMLCLHILSPIKISTREGIQCLQYLQFFVRVFKCLT